MAVFEMKKPVPKPITWPSPSPEASMKPSYGNYTKPVNRTDPNMKPGGLTRPVSNPGSSMSGANSALASNMQRPDPRQQRLIQQYNAAFNNYMNNGMGGGFSSIPATDMPQPGTNRLSAQQGRTGPTKPPMSYAKPAQQKPPQSYAKPMPVNPASQVGYAGADQGFTGQLTPANSGPAAPSTSALPYWYRRGGGGGGMNSLGALPGLLSEYMRLQGS